MSPYELFDHTADLGLRVRAASYAELLCEAARALTAALVERPEAVTPRQHLEIELSAEGGERDLLLRDWLGELLYRFSAEGFVGATFELLELSLPGKLRARVGGEPFAPQRHGHGQELKAVTYHGLRVIRDETERGGWLAELVVDL